LKAQETTNEKKPAHCAGFFCSGGAGVRLAGVATANYSSPKSLISNNNLVFTVHHCAALYAKIALF
jgi:hypothetical protein